MTPTKCGTHTLEALAKKVTRTDSAVLRMIRSQHRTVVPDGMEGYRRYTLTRNPYDRLVSTYSYLHAPQNHSQWGAKLVQDMNFDEFVIWLAKQRETRHKKTNIEYSPYIWFESVSERYLRFGSQEFMRIELIEDAFELLSDEFGYKFPRPGHSNRSKRETWPTYYTRQSTLDIVNECWAGPDCRFFGYKRIGKVKNVPNG